jgi:glucose uptake protein GlcU
MSEIASIGSSSLLKQFICGFAFLGLLLVGLAVGAWREREHERRERERRRDVLSDLERDQ